MCGLFAWKQNCELIIGVSLKCVVWWKFPQKNIEFITFWGTDKELKKFLKNLNFLENFLLKIKCE